MSSLTHAAPQWTVSGSTAARPIRPVTLFRDASGTWIATTNPADAVGHTAGVFVVDGSGQLVIDTTLSAGLRAVLAPTALLAYS